MGRLLLEDFTLIFEEPPENPSGSSSAACSALKPLNRAGSVIEFRAGTLMHAFPAKVDKGHEIKALVGDLPLFRRPGKVRLDNLIRRLKVSSAS